MNKESSQFSRDYFTEELFLTVAPAVKYQINESFSTFHFVASGNDLKTFIMPTGDFWILSVISSWYSFLTLFIQDAWGEASYSTHAAIVGFE
ncbi:Reticulon-like protein B1 [Platanthera guangdongensis]|uniref:Reticulon-like protein n=1 Tax=Platanthera guangdongensis TaxID=2320717 RepID=A0ABR2LXU2_9ASPA